MQMIIYKYINFQHNIDLFKRLEGDVCLNSTDYATAIELLEIKRWGYGKKQLNQYDVIIANRLGGGALKHNIHSLNRHDILPPPTDQHYKRFVKENTDIMRMEWYYIVTFLAK